MKPKAERLLILLADSDPKSQKWLSRLPKRIGFRVILVTTVKGTIHAIIQLMNEGKIPDVAFISLRLGKTNRKDSHDGLKAAKCAKVLGIPCIILYTAPLTQFLSKKGGPEPILAAIKEIVQPSPPSKKQKKEA